jgi:prepilin-type processing-associated H-X9-DG protein
VNCRANSNKAGRSPTGGRPERTGRAFAFPDFLLVLASLLLVFSVVLPQWMKSRARTRQAQCEANLRRVTGAILNYGQSEGRLPQEEPGMKGALWWFYKEMVKGDLGLKGPSSPADKVFACPDDRGYEDKRPFRSSAKFDYGSYVYNGVTLPGLPHVAGRVPATIKEPSITLLVMEWTAHAPLSWHRSLTGRRNHPFYNNAESVVGFVDGHVEMIPIYYDGMNAAYTRNPIPGYKYKYSAD